MKTREEGSTRSALSIPVTQSVRAGSRRSSFTVCLVLSHIPVVFIFGVAFCLDGLSQKVRPTVSFNTKHPREEELDTILFVYQSLGGNLKASLGPALHMTRKSVSSWLLCFLWCSQKMRELMTVDASCCERRW